MVSLPVPASWAGMLRTSVSFLCSQRPGGRGHQSASASVAVLCCPEPAPRCPRSTRCGQGDVFPPSLRLSKLVGDLHQWDHSEGPLVSITPVTVQKTRGN